MLSLVCVCVCVCACVCVCMCVCMWKCKHTMYTSNVLNMLFFPNKAPLEGVVWAEFSYWPFKIHKLCQSPLVACKRLKVMVVS